LAGDLGLWRNDLLPRAKRLRFIQSIGAGTDQFSREPLKQHGVRLASARGAMRGDLRARRGIMLALARLSGRATTRQNGSGAV
jgi:phosphoglycerate dehydrogenase-like enzyme